MSLDMKVVGDNRAAAVELVHRMEGSTRFQHAQLVAEGEGENGVVGAEVRATYIPQETRGSAQ